MDKDTDCQIALVDATLKQMIAQAEILVRITLDEGLALKDANVDLLNKKVQSKKEVVTVLTQLDSHFRSTLKQYGLTEQTDISLFLSNTFHDLELSENWGKYVSLMHLCDKQNQENSSLVNVGLRHTKQAIEFLHSCIGEHEQQSVYEAPQYMHRPSLTANSTIIAKA